MFYDKQYVGEYGTEIAVDCGRDISQSYTHKLKVHKPDGRIVEWECEISLQSKKVMRYIVQEGDFDVAGEYEFQAVVGLNGWNGFGATAKLFIYDRLA